MTSNSSYLNSQFYNKYCKYIKNTNSNTKMDNNLKSTQLENNTKTNHYINTSKSKNNYNKNSFNFTFDHINILGMDLFSDDILIILLIYFLYAEGVKDIYLFIVLILLLLS